MSVTIKFHTISEKVPAHGQTIIHLRQTSSFGFQGFEPHEVEVEYQATEIDEDGETGNAVCWNPEDFAGREYLDEFQLDGISYRVDMLLDCFRAQPDDLWIGVEEYWKCFDK